MNQADLSPDSVIERVTKMGGILKQKITEEGNPQLSSLWEMWEKRLARIAEDARKRPEVEISLVGGTGAGKSTLLNALLNARLLPVSNMRACTAAISEVSYADGDRYQAKIEFVSRESWRQEIDNLLDDIKDVRQNVDDDEPASTEAADIPRIARDKLWTVFRPTEDAEPSTFDIRNLREPPDITKALESGFEEFAFPELEEFRKRVAVYLDSKHRYWPIVKSVKIGGPFPALRSGAKLVDLPGINDPNEAREEVTKRHLKTCRFVWMVFPARRVLTKDTVNLMGSDDFLRQVVMDGRLDALKFVATSSDDIDAETGREEFALGEDATEVDVIMARNREVGNQVARQLDELSFRLARLTGETKGRAEALAAAFRKSTLFSVSAREYLRLSGLSKTRAAGLDSVEQTQIPALRQQRT